MSDVTEFVELAFERPAWWSEAACRGGGCDNWFTTRGEPTEHAKAVCFGCPVKQGCLEFALDNFIKNGCWGGRSERERRRMRRERRQAQRLGLPIPVALAIQELPAMPIPRPRRLPAARFDGTGLVRPPRRSEAPLTKRRRGARFDGSQLVAPGAAA